MKRAATAVLAWLALSLPVEGTAEQAIEIATGEWPPYTSATAPGFGPHAVRVERVLAAAGYRVRFRFLPWDRAYAKTVAGEFAATMSWYRSEARLQELHFPEIPIGTAGFVVFYVKSRFPDGLRATGLKDLVDRELKVVGVKSYWYARELEALSARIEYVQEGRMVWRMLAAGRADVAIEAPEVARIDVESTLGPGRLDEFGTTAQIKSDPLYIAFTRKSAIGAELARAWDLYAAKVR